MDGEILERVRKHKKVKAARPEPIIILRIEEVARRTGYSVSFLYQAHSYGWTDFPVRIQLGPKAVGWYEHEIDAWVRSRKRNGYCEPPAGKKPRARL